MPFLECQKFLKHEELILDFTKLNLEKNYQSYCYGICAIDRKLAMVNHYHRETVSSFV